MDTKKYQICKAIDAPFRLFGLTLDEAIPMIAAVLIFGFLLKDMLLAILAAACVLVGMRLLKRGRSPGFLFNSLYWRLPGYVFGAYLKRTPKSSDRHFIA